MNISLIIVIIFAIIGYHLVCKPLAFLLHKSKKGTFKIPKKNKPRDIIKIPEKIFISFFKS